MTEIDQELLDVLQHEAFKRSGSWKPTEETTWSRLRRASDTDEHALRVATEVARARARTKRLNSPSDQEEP